MPVNPSTLDSEPASGVDSRDFRNALGRFVTGVTVVTAVDAAGDFHGITVSSFSSVSLEPPLVLFCLGRRTASLDAFTAASGFGVSVLGVEQRSLAVSFAHGPKPWGELDLERWETGAPLIRDAIARIDCLREAVYEGGDHVVLLGRVVRVETREGEPLAYFRGSYTGIEGTG